MSQDPIHTSIMMLSHPVRTLSEGSEIYEQFETYLGAKNIALLRELFSDPKLLTSEVAYIISSKPEFDALTKILQLTNHESSGTEMGNSFTFLLGLRQYLAPQPHFQVDDKLIELLDHTDITKELSVDSLKLPFSRCYIELGTQRTLSQRVPNIDTGLHVLEGVYCEEGVHRQYGEGLYFMLTGSPLGKSGPLDDATNSIFLLTTPKTRTVKEALAESVAISQKVSAAENLRTSPETFVKYSLEALELLAKVLLYISLPECRRLTRPDRSRALREAQLKKSPSKRKKALKLARKAQDVILIQAAPEHLPQETPEGLAPGRKLRAHWRRGHYRMHAHGPGLSLRKLLFVQPVLVAAGSTEETPSAHYKVV